MAKKLLPRDIEAEAEKLYEEFDALGWVETKYDIEMGKTYGDKWVVLALQPGT